MCVCRGSSRRCCCCCCATESSSSARHAKKAEKGIMHGRRTSELSSSVERRHEKERHIYTHVVGHATIKRELPRDARVNIRLMRTDVVLFFFLLFKSTRFGAIAFVEKLIENQRKLMIAYKHDRNVYVQLCNMIYKFARCLWQTVLARSSIEGETTRLPPTASSCKGAMTDSSICSELKKNDTT